jgi:hypothetical protein
MTHLRQRMLLGERKLAGRTIQGVRPALKFLDNQIPFQTGFEAILLDQRSLQCQKSSNVNS